MRFRATATGLLFAASTIAVSARADDASDVAGARAVFERNLDAIRQRDRAAYFSCYVRSDALALTSPEGIMLGFAELEKGAAGPWPDAFEARDLHLAPIAPGIVYGTYRYRARNGAEERSGLSHRVFVKTPDGWRIALTGSFDAPRGTSAPPIALVGATLWDGTGNASRPDSVIVVRDGKVACIGGARECPLPDGIDRVDLKGRFIVPGIVDAHVHFSQSGWADGRPDSLDVREQHPYAVASADLESHPERLFRSYLCSGVTAVYDVGGYPWTVSMAERMQGATDAPRIAAVGPLLSTRDHWLNLPATRQFIFLKDEAAAREGVRYLAVTGAHAVKVWYIVSPDLPVATTAPAVLAAGDEARRLGLPLIVHATGLAEAKVALRAGAALLVHSVGDLPVDDEFIALAKRSGIIYCPTLTVSSGYARMYEAATAGRAPVVDDPNACVDPSTRALVAETARYASKANPAATSRMARRLAERQPIEAANLKRLSAAGVTIAMGTDAGNPLTLHGPAIFPEMEAMQAAGLSPTEVLTASTTGGARAMGIEKESGTLEKGKAADLVVIDADPTLDVRNLRRTHAVMRGGVLRTLAELQALVATAPPREP